MHRINVVDWTDQTKKINDREDQSDQINRKDQVIKWEYSWIAHQLGIVILSSLLLLKSDFKSETSFGFLSPNYTGQVTWFFVKPQNELVWLVLTYFVLLVFFYVVSILWAQNQFFCWVGTIVRILCAYI